MFSRRPQGQESYGSDYGGHPLSMRLPRDSLWTVDYLWAVFGVDGVRSALHGRLQDVTGTDAA